MDKKEQLKKLEEDLKNFKVYECEVFSRITGYYRPVNQYNPGKQEEFEHRKMFDGVIKNEIN